MWMHQQWLVREGKKVLMDYLTGHIRSAWLLTGCSTACFSLALLPNVYVTAGTPDLSDWISAQCA